MDVVKKSSDAVAKVTDPASKTMLSRVASVCVTMGAAIDAAAKQAHEIDGPNKAA